MRSNKVNEDRVDEGAENQIKKEESTRALMNYMLTSKFQKTQENAKFMIQPRHILERLFKSVPDAFNPEGKAENEQFYLVQDSSDKNPSYENILYCTLDYQIVLMSALWFYLFDKVTKNSMAAIFLTYCVERIIRFIRAEKGAKNLSKKTMIDSAFLK